jgi:hypothetical protein
MFRLLKYLPVIIPVVTKFVKSPAGQKAIATAKAQIAAKRGGPARGTR